MSHNILFREGQQAKWENYTAATYYKADRDKIQQFDIAIDKFLPPAPASVLTLAL